MTDKELKRLNRSELLEMLIGQMEENEKLKIELEQAREQANSRQIAIDHAGSIAEAALTLNGVFEAAQAAAAQYLENIQQTEEKARAKAQEICAQADMYSQKVCAVADDYSRETRSEADLYKKQVFQRIQALLREKGLSSLAHPDKEGGQT